MKRFKFLKHTVYWKEQNFNKRGERYFDMRRFEAKRAEGIKSLHIFPVNRFTPLAEGLEKKRARDVWTSRN